MTKAQKEKVRQELKEAEEYARKALTAVARKPVSEAKVKQVAKKVARAMVSISSGVRRNHSPRSRSLR